jgi:hypothetical protein
MNRHVYQIFNFESVNVLKSKGSLDLDACCKLGHARPGHDHPTRSCNHVAGSLHLPACFYCPASTRIARAYQELVQVLCATLFQATKSSKPQAGCQSRVHIRGRLRTWNCSHCGAFSIRCLWGNVHVLHLLSTWCCRAASYLLNFLKHYTCAATVSMLAGSSALSLCTCMWSQSINTPYSCGVSPR